MESEDVDSEDVDVDPFQPPTRLSGRARKPSAKVASQQRRDAERQRHHEEKSEKVEKKQYKKIAALRDTSQASEVYRIVSASDSDMEYIR